MKAKAGALSSEAQNELKKSSQIVQARTGNIELYSAKYYATCTLGGLLACVGFADLMSAGRITHRVRVLLILL